MGYLLDTHVFLWALSDPERIRGPVLPILLNPAHPVYVSAISAVEISIKQSLGKLQAPDHLEKEIESRGFRTLPVEYRHGSRLSRLPNHHPDPFDRILIAQAIEEGLTLITHDQKFRAYPVKLLFT